MKQPDAKAVTLILVPAPGNWPAPPDRRLARALKALGRQYGWRCVDMRGELPEEPANNEWAGDSEVQRSELDSDG